MTGKTGAAGHSVGRLTRVGLAATVCAALLVVAPDFVAAASGAIPLPRLRPPMSASAARAATNTQAAPARPFVANPNSRFTPAQQRLLAGINSYFNSFRILEGQFIQFGPSGEQSEGVFFMTRPGRIRFHYSPPSKLDVVADGSSVAIRDGKTRTQDLYPLSATPLRYLLAEHIDLTSENVVRSVTEEADLISLTIVDGGAGAQGKLTLIFDRKSFELRQWVVTDAQGLNTSVAIYNTTTGKPQNPNLFRITAGSTF